MYPNFNVNWKNYWAKAFVFDALIGNTDRHQDNWGIIIAANYNDSKQDKPVIKSVRISPVFDNGTSMGHEISSKKFKGFEDKNRVRKYILKGHHHMKWNINDAFPMKHAEMLKKIAGRFPETHSIMQNCLKSVNCENFRKVLDDLVTFHVPVKLTVERANFMLELLQYRHEYLLDELGN